MKQLTLFLVLFAFAAACNPHHSSVLNQKAKQEVTADLNHLAKKSGFEKVEYELIKEDNTGDPFKIKLYFYSDQHSKDQNIEKASKEVASKFIRNAHNMSDYKLIEVNLISTNGKTSETIFYTTKLARI